LPPEKTGKVPPRIALRSGFFRFPAFQPRGKIFMVKACNWTCRRVELSRKPGGAKVGELTFRCRFLDLSERTNVMPWWFWILLVVLVVLVGLLIFLRNKKAED
jgi:hypothetical protein